MNIINQSYEICKTHGYTLQDIYKDIERAARVSYKSEDKITEDSAEKMVERLINMKHYSPLEFGTVYLKFPNTSLDEVDVEKYETNHFSAVTITKDSTRYVTTNYRVIVENHWEDDLKYMCEPTKHHQRRITVHFITNRAVSHELVRHRSMSFMQESQRYVAYDKNKFGNEITFIRPVLMYTDEQYKQIWQALSYAETAYMNLRKSGLKPQQARCVLPNATKTELYMCGFEGDWDHFFDLRDKPTVDPQMYDLVCPLHQEYSAYLDKIGDKLHKSEAAEQLKSIYP